MANYEATRYDIDGSNLTGIEGVNTGLIVPWSGGSVPSGFLECDGTAVSRTTYSALFAVVGTTYGSGDGSTTFNVPDLNDKIVKGKSPTTNLGTANNTNTKSTSGNVAGSAAPYTLTTPEIPSHTHARAKVNPTGERNPQGGGSFTGSGGLGNNTGGSGAHTHNLSATFTGDDADIEQPNIVTQYIIKT